MESCASHRSELADQCPLWVISGTYALQKAMSANVRFVPRADMGLKDGSSVFTQHLYK
jgi:hypothetical protein